MRGKIFQNWRATIDGEKAQKHQIASQKVAKLTGTFQGMNKENEALKSVRSHRMDIDQGNQRRISQSIAGKNEVNPIMNDFHR
jgi:hypothetical protein